MFPHHPDPELQHSPAAKPRQLYPYVLPQVPSGVAIKLGVAVAVAETVPEAEDADTVAGGVKEDTVATRPEEASLYQLDDGSPKHSPIVTPV